MKIRIELFGTKPAISRVIYIGQDITFHRFHYIIQLAMGWENMHLYQFILPEKSFIGDPELFDYKTVVNARNTKVSKYLSQKNDTIRYEYDFGDGWLHKITVLETEKELSFSCDFVCIEGHLNCPPRGLWRHLWLFGTCGILAKAKINKCEGTKRMARIQI